MEVKEGERVVIAKPIASRPSCSSFRTFTELLNTSSVMVSPESILHESSLDAAIRPKTVRFRATGNNGASSTLQSPQGKDNSINKACEETENKNYVVYKPKAKLVSKATVSVLANMLQGNNSQQPWKQQSQTGKNVRQNGRSLTEQETTSSMDGYNWRKYGQKQVKGSECPRSYYKCTHPNCPVKKKVERSIDGQISEIVYQGEHNHSKPPCPLPRRASGKPPVISSHQGTTRQDPNVYYPIWNEPFEFAVPRSANSDSGCKSSQCDEGSNVEVDDLSKSKRRRNEKQSSDGGGGGGSETQGSVDSESLEDGFRWRKYGQKVVGGNAYPRSYYRCTSANCRARKHVERASDDPRAFITTYEGKHNHHFLYTPPSTTTSTLPAFYSPQHSNK